MREYLFSLNRRARAFCFVIAATFLSICCLSAFYDFRSAVAAAWPDGLSSAFGSEHKTAAHEQFNCGMARQTTEAKFELSAPQVAPSDIDISEKELIAILNRSSKLPLCNEVYGLKVPQFEIGSVSADVVKVIATNDPSWPYLAVYHHHDRDVYFKTALATSRDLGTWQPIRTLSDTSSMPDIRVLPDGSVLFAHERNPSGKRPFIDVMYFPDLVSFADAAEPRHVFSVPHVPGATAEGTPSFGRISYNGDIANSTIELTYHYFENGINDQNAGGILKRFSDWRSATSSELNRKLRRMGYLQVGGRERFRVGETVYELVEGRKSNAAGWDEWRVFLVNRCNGRITKLAPRLAGGAKSVGNPKISFVKLPRGEWGILTTLFVFSEGSADTPAGTHISVYALPSQQHAALVPPTSDRPETVLK